MTLALVNIEKCLILKKGFQFFIFFPNQHFTCVQFYSDTSWGLWESVRPSSSWIVRTKNLGQDGRNRRVILMHPSHLPEISPGPRLPHTANKAAVTTASGSDDWLDGKSSRRKPSTSSQLWHYLRKMSLWGSLLGAKAVKWRKITGNIKLENQKLSKKPKHLLITMSSVFYLCN